MTGPSKLKGSSCGGGGGGVIYDFFGWRGPLDLEPFAYIRPSVPAILLLYYF